MSSKDPNRNEEQPVTWTEEEERQLASNMQTYPADKYTELKRYTLLLTNLPHKRLRDVATKVKFLDYRKSHPDVSWADFCKDKNLTRPQRMTGAPKVNSHSSSDNSDIEGSSIKIIGKRSPRNTPMMMEKMHIDSIDVPGSVHMDEPRQAMEMTDQLPPTISGAKGKKKTKTAKKKTKGKQMGNPTAMNPVQMQHMGMDTQMGMMPMGGMMPTDPMNGMMPAGNDGTGSNSLMNGGSQGQPDGMMQMTDPTFQNQQVVDFQTMCSSGEMILHQLDMATKQQQSTHIPPELVMEFHQYVQHIIFYTQMYAQPLQLPDFNKFMFTPDAIEQLTQDPRKIYEFFSYDQSIPQNNGGMQMNEDHNDGHMNGMNTSMNNLNQQPNNDTNSGAHP